MKGLSKSSLRTGLTLTIVLGILLIVLGSLFLGILNLIVESIVEKNLALLEGKESFDKWKTTPIPVFFSVYLFNITNPHEIKTFGRKPIVQEVGPFVFRQQRRKEVKEWDHINKTVTYKDIKTFHFIPEVSVNIETEICMLNMPLMGMTKIEDRVNYLFKSSVATALDQLSLEYNETVFIYRPAKLWLFEGYKVNMLADIFGILKPFVDIESPLPNNTFGFLYGKNNSGDGIFKVYTGEDDISKYTQIVEWNGVNRLDWWKDEYCDMVNGTDGGQFAPPITKNDVLYVFAAELCRSVFLEFVGEVEVKGILAYRFMTPFRLFASPLKNPDNMCFCTMKEYCHVHGLLDLSVCRKGVHIGVTGPHFLDGHEEFTSSVEGLNPNAELHSTYIDIEPNTGIVMRASRKLQMNYGLKKYAGFSETKNLPDAILPLLWLIEEANIDDKLADTFKSKVKTPVTVAKSVLTACIVLGVLWIVTAGIVTGCIVLRKQKAPAKQKTSYAAVSVGAVDQNETPELEKA